MPAVPSGGLALYVATENGVACSGPWAVNATASKRLLVFSISHPPEIPAWPLSSSAGGTASSVFQDRQVPRTDAIFTRAPSRCPRACAWGAGPRVRRLLRDGVGEQPYLLVGKRMNEKGYPGFQWQRSNLGKQVCCNQHSCLRCSRTCVLQSPGGCWWMGPRTSGRERDVQKNDTVWAHDRECGLQGLVPERGRGQSVRSENSNEGNVGTDT